MISQVNDLIRIIIQLNIFSITRQGIKQQLIYYQIHVPCGLRYAKPAIFNYQAVTRLVSYSPL